MPQYFKGDTDELKYYNSGAPVMDDLSLQKDLFYEGAFESYKLGEIIWDSGRSPLANAISREIFREAFPEIFNTFLIAGTFESYLSIFRKIFGTNVIVNFTVPAPGKLIIDIDSEDLETNTLQVRSIINNSYVFDDLLTRGSEQILVRSVKGMDSQYELEQMLFELVPDGIFTDINLNL